MPQLELNGKVYTSDKEKAEKVTFNPYTLRRKPAALNWQHAVCEVKETLGHSALSHLHQVTYMMNYGGSMSLPGWLLNEGAEWIAEPLSWLFNKSMAAGILPSDWTIANVTPIHKKMTNTLLATIVPLVSQALL